VATLTPPLSAHCGWHPRPAQERKPEASTPSPYVYVDAHVLATPILVDLESDNQQELIVPVTYYFDRCDDAVVHQSESLGNRLLTSGLCSLAVG